MRKLLPTAIIAALYALFWRWYSGVQRPLSPNEIDRYMAKLHGKSGNPAALARVRAFLEADTGRDFVMVNLIKLHDKPQWSQLSPPPGTSAELLQHYSTRFLSRLLRRAGHPVLQGTAAADALEVWGVLDAERWSLAGLVRYRSRRDMIEAATAPDFSDLHGYKTAAIEKTIALPTDPWLHLGDPRLLVGLLAIIALLMTQRRADN